VIARKLRQGTSELVWNTEEYLGKAIIGGAITEADNERRVEAWVSNVKKARDAIAGQAVALTA
jgi:hypothetical protein